jgi:hypothetical protein
VHPGNNPLHRARLRSGVTLSQLAARTLLSPRVVQKIDEGRFAELPGGLYARSYVRTFASAVGLDPDEAVRGLAEHLPTEDDPFAMMRQIARSCDPPWVSALEDARTSASAWLASRSAAITAMTTMTIGAVLDAAVLLAVQLVLIQTTAWTCGLAPEVLLREASGPIAVVWGILVLAYFVVVDGIGASARRAFVCRWPAVPDPAWPFDLPAILGRALQAEK